MDTPESLVGTGSVRTLPDAAPKGSPGSMPLPPPPGWVTCREVVAPNPQAATPSVPKQAAEPRVRLSPGSSVFLAGFGLSLLLLMLEYLTAGGFPGWFILVPTNPTILLGALVGHKVEAAVGAQWSDEAFFATLGVESALWWYMVGVLVAVIRRRRAHRVLSETKDFKKTR